MGPDQKYFAFKQLDPEWLKTYMPLSYDQQPEESWEEIAIDGKIYAVPKAKATFTAYNVVAVRQDLIDEYDLTVPDLRLWRRLTGRGRI